MSSKALSTLLILIIALLTMPFVLWAGNIDPDSTGCKYAWGENIGWINFNPSQGSGVIVTDSNVTGFAWGENIGWISLSCLDAGTCATVIYGVMNDEIGNLSGYAWGENVGWINFKPANGGVSIGSDGKFTGYAWGENIGWINFSAAHNCVKTAWAPNRPPVTQDQVVTTAKNTVKGIVLTATDPEGAPLTFAIVTPPTHGILTGTAPNLTYTPAADYYGPDSFTFKANDGTADSNIATVSITVNAAPVVSATADTTISIGSLFTGSGSFTDPDPETWTATVDYGDGSGIQLLLLKPDKTFTLAHVYAAIGMFTVNVVVTDSTGASGTWSSSVTVLTPVSITVQTSPADRRVTVDGVDYTAPQTFSWTPGSSHAIAITSPQSETLDTRYVFANWSDGGAMGHSITTPTIATTYTANFTTQYQLTTAAGPGGSVTPTRGNWYDAGTVVNLLATPDTGYVFDSWSGPVEKSGNAATTVTMSQPQSVTANFILTTGTVTVQAFPAGRSFTVDGVAYTSPQTFAWIPGSSHTIATTSPQSGAPGTRYNFTDWSDGGAMSHTITTPATTTTYTANFTTQYQLTTSAGAGGSVTPPSGNWYDAGTVVNLLATPDSGYFFSSWNGLGGSAAITVTMNQPLSMTASFTLFTITVHTSAPGLSFTVDGTTYTSTQTFTWTPGSSHTIATTSPQSGTPGTRYLFSNWSDGGPMSHTITTPTISTTYTANFSEQFQLTTIAGAGGSVTPATGNWYDSGTVVHLQATPDPGYVFSSWSGPVANSGSAATTITLTRPQSVTANFNLTPGNVSVETYPPGRSVTVDGVTYTAPRIFTWTPGSSHTIATTSSQSGTSGTQYVFTNWSDGGAMSHTITAPTTGTTYTAYFTTQYQLTTAVSPSGKGTVTPASGGWYDLGTKVDLMVIPDPGYVFSSWTGPVADIGNSATTVVIDQPQSVTANLLLTSRSVTVQTSPPGLSIIVDSITYTAPRTFEWIPGSSHTIATTSPQSGTAGTRYVFADWSDGGAMSHTITAPTTGTTYTANFTTQYQLTTTAGTGGSVAPPSGNWYDATTVVNLQATPDSGYIFSSWSGPVANSSSAATTVTMTQPQSAAASFILENVSILVHTTYPGLSITVDGVSYTTAQTFTWKIGSSHTIATTSPQSVTPGTRYVFANWSDGGAMIHTITIPTISTTYTANFNEQNQLTTTAGTGGSVTPPSGNWYDSGTVVNLQATPDPGYVFSSWSGPVANSGSAATAITLTRPQSVTANFNLTPGNVSVETYPLGLTVTVDGVTYTTPRIFTWTPGSSHTIATTSPQGSGGTRYVFTSWSDGGLISHTVTAASSSTTYTATFDTQFLLTTSVSPSGAGSISTNPTSSDGYYSSFTHVQLTATANSGYQFANWSGDLTGSTNPQSLTMSAPKSVIVHFNYTITATAGSGGSISPPGITTLNAGGSQTYTITPNVGYHTADVSVDGVSQGAIGTYTFTNVTANHTISASFTVESNLSFSVRAAIIKWWNKQQTIGFVTMTADFGATKPANTDVVSVSLDGVQLFSAPFSEFKRGLLPDAYLLVRQDLLVRLDFSTHRLFVATPKMSLVGLNTSNGVDVQMYVGAATAVENIMMTPAPLNSLIYRRTGVGNNEP